ncbi:MAG TPA: type II toxin-antitoxin system VapC family toxin [Anaerolineales bacterium]|nr:type II toxin-antitoxin system VapC family toxin [Anaerolineales bacterium]
MIIYFDTSALVKRYLREADSDKIMALFNEADHIIGSVVITQVEMAATFQRAVSLDVASPKLAAEIWQDFLDHWQSFTRLRIFAGTIERASENAWKYDLRGYDSLHLAAALLWQETLGVQVTLATFDRELWLAGQKAGMLSWPEGLVSE